MQPLFKGNLNQMTWLSLVVAAYGVLNIVGGYLGYQSGSSISLYAGGGLGVLCLIAAYISTKHRAGFLLAALLSLAGAGNFISRYMKTQAIWPALIMAIISIVVFCCLGAGHFIAKKQKQAA